MKTKLLSLLLLTVLIMALSLFTTSCGALFPVATEPFGTPICIHPPPRPFHTWYTNDLDCAVKAVMEEDYHRMIIGEDAYRSTEEPYHAELFDALRVLDYFPTLSCFTNEKNEVCTVEFCPRDKTDPHIKYQCECNGSYYQVYIWPTDPQCKDASSAIEYYNMRYPKTFESQNWEGEQAIERNGKTINAMIRSGSVAFLEDGMFICVRAKNTEMAITLAKMLEILKIPYPNDRIIMENELSPQLRLDETTYQNICSWIGSKGVEVEPNVYEWQIGYVYAKTVRLYFQTVDGGEALVLVGYQTPDMLEDGSLVLSADMFLQRIESGKTTYADLRALTGEEGDFLEPFLCEWTLDGIRSQTVRVTLAMPFPEAPVDTWTVVDFIRLDGEKVVLFEDFLSFIIQHDVTYRDVYEFMGRHGVLAWENNYVWMIGEDFTEWVSVGFNPGEEGESIYDLRKNSWGYD